MSFFSLSVLSAATFSFWTSLQKLSSICFWTVTSVGENKEKANTIQLPFLCFSHLQTIHSFVYFFNSFFIDQNSYKTQIICWDSCELLPIKKFALKYLRVWCQYMTTCFSNLNEERNSLSYKEVMVRLPPLIKLTTFLKKKSKTKITTNN